MPEPKPHRQLTPDEAEQDALVKAIIKSHYFSGTDATLRISLLEYLWKNYLQQKSCDSKELAHEVFPHLLRATQGLADVGVQTTVRRQCAELKQKLYSFSLLPANRTQKWRCELPKAGRKGYLLSFADQNLAPRVALDFWQAHFEPLRQIPIVFNAPVFYRHDESHLVFRLVDINVAPINIEALREKHPEWFKEGVYPSHPYLFIGEIDARDHLQEWLRESAAADIDKCLSRDISGKQIDESSPILLGNPRTNQHIRTLFAENARKLPFRLNPNRFASVEAHYSSEQEATEQKARMEIHCEAPIRQDEKVLTLIDDPNNDVFAVVTRLPNPSGEGGSITMLCCDYTRSLGSLAKTLTDDKRLYECMKLAGWAAGTPIPAYFQWLFAVKLREAGEAKPRLLAHWQA